jgi:hypothetical protein
LARIALPTLFVIAVFAIPLAKERLLVALVPLANNATLDYIATEIQS